MDESNGAINYGVRERRSFFSRLGNWRTIYSRLGFLPRSLVFVLLVLSFFVVGEYVKRKRFEDSSVVNRLTLWYTQGELFKFV